jgi:uncharacterized membrane protein
MSRWLIAWIATLITMLAIDSVWLSQMANLLYRPIMRDTLLDQFRAVPAIMFYLLYTAGLVFFAVRPALASGRWPMALANGAILGLVAYGTYDLTNQATLKNWSTMLTVADLIWGSFVSCAASAMGWLAASRWQGRSPRH